MSNIVINNLEMNQELDKHAVAGITGGRWYGPPGSSGDYHTIYNGGSPYGRDPKAAPFDNSYRSYSWGF